MNYQGYKNYETFLVDVTMGNDREQAAAWKTIARDIWAESVAEGVLTRSDRARHALADFLKQDYEDRTPELGDVWGSLLSAALEKVCWDEIADLLLEKVEGYEKHHFPWDAEPV
ncbi:MAG: hypothetical protein LC130_10785 [Bryobacterales bacterium]|nr:hypothetical protein [Bryobacterales bacterium]